MYNSCSKSNASYFIMLSHDARGGCWWDSRRGWTFSPIFHYVLLLCDRWQQRGSLAQWCLIWKCVWSKGVALNSSVQNKWHPPTVIDACWTAVETKQWKLEQGGCEWCVSIVATAQMFISMTRRLLFIAGKNAYLIVVTILKSSVS